MERIWDKHKKINTTLKPKVFVGLSGGVDSALAAALLKEAGYEVLGRFIKGYAPPGIPCPEEKDIADAREVARDLGINFEVIAKGSEIYRQEIYNPFMDEYFAGRTPNPDVHCNRAVKFPFLIMEKEKYNADFIATGHYFQRLGNSFYRGLDSVKDQSYFLFAVPRGILLSCLFPLGGLTKSVVRRMAEERGIKVARKKGTRGVCMVGELTIPEAIEWEAEERGLMLPPARALLRDKGKIIEELGTIPGHIFLAATIGQRQGFGLAYRFPVYVVEKDMTNRILYFGILPKGFKQLVVSQLNWISPHEPAQNFEAMVKVRTPGKLQNCRAESIGDQKLLVTLQDSDPGIAPGQAAVFYVADHTKGQTEMLGGGIIASYHV